MDMAHTDQADLSDLNLHWHGLKVNIYQYAARSNCRRRRWKAGREGRGEREAPSGKEALEAMLLLLLMQTQHHARRTAAWTDLTARWPTSS
jgi:hypothetical protein